MTDRVGVGLIGSQFISSIHAEALKSVPDADVRAVMSPTDGHALDFAARHGIPRAVTVLDDLLVTDGVDMVIV